MPSDVGKRIAFVRQELRLGVVEFARKAGLSNSIIYQVEAGTKEMGLSTLERLSQTYGISLNWLVFGLGPMYLKDTQLPFRGDAMEVMGKNFPITDAPDLAELLQDRQVMEKIEITADEIQELGEFVKHIGRMARLYTKEEWLESIHKMRQTKLDVLDDLRRELKKP